MGAEIADDHAGGVTFGALLREHRRTAALSQRELAGSADVSVTTVRDLEQERTRRPQPHSVDALVVALHLSGETERAFRRAAVGAGHDGPTGRAVAEGRLRVAVLGPLAVHCGSTPLAVGGPRRRTVLARLALSANTPVPVADLIDLLWEERPPDAAAHTVHTYVSRLRSALRPAVSGPVISRQPAGYQLHLADDQLDLTEFRHAVRLADAAQPDQALDLFAAALMRWRGNPLGDVAPLRDHPLVTALMDERIAMTLRYADLAIAAGEARRCLSPLRQLAADHPLNEPVHARLLLALAAEQRQADALAAFADVRRRLVEELGIEPGRELAAAHRRVLRQEVAIQDHSGSTRVPAQLPAAHPSFSGRAEALAALDRLVGTPAAIAVVSGTAGVGKTALVVQWAHRVADRFPDGQLYLNLRGYSTVDAAVSADEAVRMLLDGLGVPAARVPAGLDTRAALYRSIMSRRRMVVVLDNARDAAQVRPLLPASTGSLVVVTSRNRLTGLVAVEGAVPLPIDVLSHEESRSLLAGRLGPGRIAHERAAVDDIVERCAGLPLALAVAAARAATSPRHPLAAVARALTGARPRLDPFISSDATIDVRTVFSWSYRLLPPPVARLFRLLGLHQGGDISVAVAASLTGIPAEQVMLALTELVDAHLLTEVRPDRYDVHDLLRAYAREQVSGDPDARPALRRLVDHYLHTAASAARQLDPFRSTDPLPRPGPGVTPEDIGDRDQAMAWFAAEYRMLLACVSVAAESDDAALALHPALITRTLGDYQLRTGRWSDGLAASQVALAAARHRGDRTGEGLAQYGIARGYAYLGDVENARTAGLAAAAICHEAALHVAEADAYRCVANALADAGQFDEALRYAELAAELSDAHGDSVDRALGLNTYGWMLAETGRHAEAVEPLQQALRLQEALDDYGSAFTLDSLGQVYLRLGRLSEAETYYRRSLDLFVQNDHRFGMVYPLCGLGDVFAARGDIDAARTVYRRALRLCQQAGHHHRTAGVVERLSRL